MIQVLLTTIIFAALIAGVHLSYHGVAEDEKWSFYYVSLLAVVLSFGWAFFSKKIRLDTSSIFKKYGDFALTLFLGAGIYFQTGFVNFPALIFGAGLSVVLILYFKKVLNEPLGVGEQFLVVVLGALAWRLSYRLVWWSPNHLFDMFNLYPEIIFSILLGVTVIILGLMLNSQIRSSKNILYFRRFLEFISIIAIGYMCGRPYAVAQYPLMLHHHGFYVGPLELIKQGGALLWDVPSQYGLLNIYLASKLNTGDSWKTFLIYNKVFDFFYFVTLFYFLKLYFKSTLGIILSALLTLSAGFYWIGFVADVSGPFPMPSVGGLRFIWCLVLLMVCFWISRRGDIEDKIWRRRMHVGSLVWIISLFWSVEVLVYGTAIWLTFNAVQIIMKVEDQPIVRAIKNLFLRMTYLFLTPVIVFAIVNAWYFLSLGHLPDWENYIEYARAYQGGFGALPMELSGAVWVLLFLFIWGVSLSVLAYKQRSKSSPFMFAAVGLLWAVASYFISRSHENNISNLTPIILAFITSMWLTLKDIKIGASFNFKLAILCLPLITVFAEIPLTLANFKKAIPYVDELNYTGSNLAQDQKNQVTDYVYELNLLPEIRRAMSLSPETPSQFAGAFLETLPSESNQPEFWLPLAPAAELDILDFSSQQVYIDRFSARKQKGGWLFRYASKRELYPHLYKLLEKNFTKVETRVYGIYLAERFVYHQ